MSKSVYPTFNNNQISRALGVRATSRNHNGMVIWGLLGGWHPNPLDDTRRVITSRNTDFDLYGSPVRLRRRRFWVLLTTIYRTPLCSREDQQCYARGWILMTPRSAMREPRTRSA
ncbi:hypothetical protein GALMADRAFT_253292 [Galerina marginata CBS 339.88]|uniref:Uncharacterized protein n=1 Tax=Galerina marginata (strain CBS 339.88) TaxID=685588 RepID=A0A067SWE6_GALM3|nr:hypothetical protein GALMADRAFT_253292 [Galerina marginata CBS 339.88]